MSILSDTSGGPLAEGFGVGTWLLPIHRDGHYIVKGHLVDGDTMIVLLDAANHYHQTGSHTLLPTLWEMGKTFQRITPLPN